MFNMESRHLLNLSVQNALDCISENFNLKQFPGKACARNSLEKCAVRRPDERYIAPILPLYIISLGPLYHKIFRPPLKQHLIFQRQGLAYKWVNSLAPTYLCPNFRERPLDVREKGAVGCHARRVVVRFFKSLTSFLAGFQYVCKHARLSPLPTLRKQCRSGDQNIYLCFHREIRQYIWLSNQKKASKF